MKKVIKKEIKKDTIKSEKKHYQKLENILSKTLSDLAKQDGFKIK